jgi:hypothetical protein
MMRRDLDGNDLFNSLMLEIRATAVPILVVEGESDFNLTSDFMASSTLQIVVGYGKLSLLQAAQLAAPEDERIHFLVDADFDRLTGSVDSYSSNISATERYDLYMDLYMQMPSILTRIVARYLKETAVDAIDAISHAVTSAVKLGRLRFLSVTEGIDLNLEGFPLHAVMPKDMTAEIDVVDLVEMATKRTAAGVSSPDILDRLAALDNAKDGWMVNSHDLLSALHVVCTQQGTAKIGHKFDDLFELAVDRADFDRLAVVGAIRAWHDIVHAA